MVLPLLNFDTKLLSSLKIIRKQKTKCLKQKKKYHSVNRFHSQIDIHPFNISRKTVSICHYLYSLSNFDKHSNC